MISDMDPLVACELRKATSKKRKADAALVVGESSGIQAMAALEVGVAPSDTLEVAPLVAPKHFRSSKASVSSFAPRLVIFERVLGD